MADWIEPFLTELTTDGRVTTGDRRVVKMPFMRDREPASRRFVQLDGADAVELPYQGGRLAMWLIVPHDPNGLTAVEESLDSQNLTGLGVIAQQGLCRSHQAQVGTDPPAYRPVRVAPPAGVLRQSAS